VIERKNWSVAMAAGRAQPTLDAPHRRAGEATRRQIQGRGRRIRPRRAWKGARHRLAGHHGSRKQLGGDGKGAREDGWSVEIAFLAPPRAAATTHRWAAAAARNLACSSSSGGGGCRPLSHPRGDDTRGVHPVNYLFLNEGNTYTKGQRPFINQSWSALS
jgi:hypothetical protein